MALWIGPNLARFERPVALTTNDGTTLLGANCPETYSADTGRLGGWSLECALAVPLPVGEDPSIRARRQRSEAVSFIRGNLSSVPLVVAARLGRALDVYGWSNLVDFDAAEGKPRWAVWVGMALFWVLGVLAIAGFCTLDALRRSSALVIIGSVVVATVLFYGSHRIRAPAEPIIAVLASAGACRRQPDRHRNMNEAPAASAA